MFLTSSRSQFAVPLTEAEFQQGEKIVDSTMVTAPGFRVHYMIMISDTEMFSLSVWDSEADFQKAVETGRPAMQKLLESKLAGTSQVTSGQVRLRSEKNGAGKPARLVAILGQRNRPFTEADVQWMEKEMAPIFMEAPGFRECYMVEVSATERLDIMVWDSVADAQKFHDTHSSPGALPRLPGSELIGTPQRMAGQVRTYRVKGS
jgi:heme-degrading monooxygenase HmoA